jgi:hypothetical protein
LCGGKHSREFFFGYHTHPFLIGSTGQPARTGPDALARQLGREFVCEHVGNVRFGKVPNEMFHNAGPSGIIQPSKMVIGNEAASIPLMLQLPTRPPEAALYHVDLIVNSFRQFGMVDFHTFPFPKGFKETGLQEQPGNLEAFTSWDYSTQDAEHPPEREQHCYSQRWPPGALQ